VERFKTANGTSTSAAVDQIVQRSELGPSRLRNVNGFLVLSEPAENSGARHRVTLDDIKRAEDEMDRDYVKRMLNRHPPETPRKRKRGTQH